jgi:hypothetical protein
MRYVQGRSQAKGISSTVVVNGLMNVRTCLMENHHLRQTEKSLQCDDEEKSSITPVTELGGLHV